MSDRRFVVALLLPVMVTGVVMAAAARNRSSGRGPTTLSERELSVSRQSADDTTASLSLAWSPSADAAWPGLAKLAELGFDVSIAPSADGANEFYARALPMRVFVALELDGPAFAAVMEQFPGNEVSAIPPVPDGDFRRRMSRLVVVDVARDAAALEPRYPNPRTHLIAAASMRIYRMDRPASAGPIVGGSIISIDPSQISVAGALARSLPASNGFGRGGPAPLAVDLYYGSAGEPWVADVRQP